MAERKVTVELLDGSKVHSNKWKLESGGIWPAMTPAGIVKVEDVIFERRDGKITEHKKIYIPITSIIAIYENIDR